MRKDDAEEDAHRIPLLSKVMTPKTPIPHALREEERPREADLVLEPMIVLAQLKLEANQCEDWLWRANDLIQRWLKSLVGSRVVERILLLIAATGCHSQRLL